MFLYSTGVTHSYSNIIDCIPYTLHPCDCFVTAHFYFLIPSPLFPNPPTPSPKSIFLYCKSFPSYFKSSMWVIYVLYTCMRFFNVFQLQILSPFTFTCVSLVMKFTCSLSGFGNFALLYFLNHDLFFLMLTILLEFSD